MVMASAARTALRLRRDVDTHVAEWTVVTASRILILNILAAVRRLLRNNGLDLTDVISLIPEYVGLLRQVTIGKQLIIFESKLVCKVIL
jgi:hypothetical protein